MQNKIIKNSAVIGTFLSIGLGATAVFFWLQSYHVPKVNLEQHVASQKTIDKQATSAVKPTVIIPTVKPTKQASKQQTRLVIKRNLRKLYVYQGDSLHASYPVAVGKPGMETPIGKFKVIEMLKNPDWTDPATGKVVPPSPNNPLGERWIAFWNVGREYIGFHGTPNRASIGKAVSSGCVRMYNEHVLELYDMVKLDTPVLVEP
jgi:lipoprotein-anchoring transpeptidase ErfK/SrfK